MTPILQNGDNLLTSSPTAKLLEIRMVDRSNLRLGKGAAKFDHRVRSFDRYTTSRLPAPPESVNWLGTRTDWGMYLNDQLGDCTICGMVHGLQVVTQDANVPYNPTDNDALRYYEVIDGFNPNDSTNTDNGGILADVLAFVTKHGFCGQHLAGSCSIDFRNQLHVMQAIDLFAHLYVGVQLPISAQTQEVWDIPPGTNMDDHNWAPGGWGGHCVSVHAFDKDGVTCITWGAPLKITWRWWNAYADEAFGLLWYDWIKAKTGLSPSGFDIKELLADTIALR